MPLYEFWCTKCGTEYEELVPLTSKETPPCPECGSKEVVKMISFFGTGSSKCATSGFS